MPVLKQIEFKFARVSFYSTSQPPHVLKGRTELIIPDHTAFEDLSNKAHFKDYFFMIQENKRRNLPNENHK